MLQDALHHAAAVGVDAQLHRARRQRNLRGQQHRAPRRRRAAGARPRQLLNRMRTHAAGFQCAVMSQRVAVGKPASKKLIAEYPHAGVLMMHQS